MLRETLLPYSAGFVLALTALIAAPMFPGCTPSTVRDAITERVPDAPRKKIATTAKTVSGAAIGAASEAAASGDWGRAAASTGIGVVSAIIGFLFGGRSREKKLEREGRVRPPVVM